MFYKVGQPVNVTEACFVSGPPYETSILIPTIPLYIYFKQRINIIKIDFQNNTLDPIEVENNVHYTFLV